MRSSVTVFAALALLGGTPALAQAPAPPAPAAPPSELEQAQQLIEQGQSERALTLLEPIISNALQHEAKDPKAACPGVAAAVLRMFMPDKNLTVTVRNDYCEAMLAKGYALTELKRGPEAEQVLAMLVGHDPNNPNYLIEYAFAVRSNGNNERGLALYKQAEKVAARSSDKESARHFQAVALRGQGYALAELQRWDEAVRAYRQSQRFEPNDKIAASELIWIEQNRPH